MKQFIYLILFASFFGNWITSSTALAKTYTGRIDKANGRYYIYKSNTRYELALNNTSIELALQRLKSKDFISLEGMLIPAVNKNKTARISVNEVNYVGLNDLLDFWTDQFGYCYYFSSFTSMKTYYPNSRLPCSSKSIPKLKDLKLATYNYFINPYDEGDWNLLLSNATEQYFAELTTIDTTTQKLVLYNSYDGALLSEVILYRAEP